MKTFIAILFATFCIDTNAQSIETQSPLYFLLEKQGEANLSFSIKTDTFTYKNYTWHGGAATYSKANLKKTEPLLFIDKKRVRFSQFSSIDPLKIKAVSVVKGAEAIEKYGKKGKNAVILITLKKEPTT